MTIVTANALFRYFKTLYNLNQNMIALCGADVFDHIRNAKRYFRLAALISVSLCLQNFPQYRCT